MWKLNKIEAQNICAFKELAYTIHQGVTTLVYGDNRDNESQRSNGSGKSALIECVALGTTGSPLRKIKNEEIINDEADNCFVKLVFDNDSAKEVFTVEREFFRKGASIVRCHIVRDDKVVESDEAIQSSVDQYNKYILEKLGITKDELFNNFILCKHKYQDFLSSSDREKKEIINRFSNGILVDDAIVKIEEDIVPIQNDLNVESMEFAGFEGRVKMLEEQIEQEENGSNEKTRTKQEKITGLNDSIATKREGIKNYKAEIVKVEAKILDIAQMDKDVQTIENSEMPVMECYESLKFELSTIGTLSDWSATLSEKKEKIVTSNTTLEGLNRELIDAKNKVSKFNVEQKQIEKKYQQLSDECKTKEIEYTKEESSLKKKIETINTQISNLKKQNRTLLSDIETLKNKIAGTIICPECSHEFLVSDKEFDVVKGDTELKQKQTEQQNITAEITNKEQTRVKLETSEDKIAEDRRADTKVLAQKKAAVTTAKQATEAADGDLESIELKQQRATNTISALQQEIDSMRRKLFDEAFELIDTSNRSRKLDIQNYKELIKASESSIETLQSTIDELNTASVTSLIEKLKISLKSYRLKSTEILKKRAVIEKKLIHLQEQQGRFMQFKTFLANTKIDALSKITNEFLASIGSDISIRFSGYTVLKTGKIREKISISLLRDGVDMGSFGKLSAGEAVRVNLASILAMQKLVNSNCDTDKGLDLLILDEILDACDEEGLMLMFSAINSFGITALIVSHGNTAESYPYKLVIIKENGRSRIEQ